MELRPTATVFISCLMVASVAANDNVGKEENFEGFARHIVAPHPLNSNSSRTISEHQSVDQPNEMLISNNRSFQGWHPYNPSAPIMHAPSAAEGEQMDSLVVATLNGKKISKQIYNFTETGKPSLCLNYLASEDGLQFNYDGHFSYEYDPQGRMITAERLSLSYPWESERYEFAYEGNSPLYTSQISFEYNEKGGWEPYKRAEYTFDENDNTTSETYYSWDMELNDWTPASKTEATYDEMNRIKTYWPYNWSTEKSKWVGDSEGYSPGQRFEYTPIGSLAKMSEFIWENEAWLEYVQTTITYNDYALETRRERAFWNRDRQDWSGGDAYGQWGNVRYNSLETKSYDDYARIIEDNVFSSKTGEFLNTWRQTWEYEELGNNITKVITYEMSVGSDGSTYPTSKVETHNLGLLELYYISYDNTTGEWLPTREEKRQLDENGFYLGGEFLNYFNGKVVNGTKEEFVYSDDFNPALGYDTPLEGRHWTLKTSVSDEWKLTNIDTFTWGPRGVMTSYTYHDYKNSDGVKATGWEIGYDFNADTSDIFIWPDANRGKDYQQNKTLKVIEYKNRNYANGNTSWQPEYSEEYVFYYSDRKTTSVDNVSIDGEKIEVARYDISGRIVTSPTSGVNIIRYSDGSTRKVIIK